MPARKGWRGPEFPGDFPSLGWEILQWIEDELIVPLGHDAGRPFVFSGWQIDTLVRFYAIDPRTGRFAYRRAVLELSKGCGKSPFAGAVAWAEFLAPTVFDGWDAAGEPVGKPRPTPWIQIAATAEDQTANTWQQIMAMAGEGAPVAGDYPVEVGKTKIQFSKGPGHIEFVTSKAGTRVGQPITFAVMDETWVWKPQNGGPGLASTIRDNLIKAAGRSIEATNAYGPGEQTVAEASIKAATNPLSRILLVSSEAPPVKDPKDPEELLPALREVYREAPWVDPEQVCEDLMADDKTVLSIRRMFLNQRVATEARFLSDGLIDDLLDPDLEPLADGTPLAVGFDGSKTRDGTAIVGVHMVTGQVYSLGQWRRPPFADRSWEVPRPQVMDALHAVFTRFDVARMKMDPAYWGDELAQLQQAYGKDIVDRFPTSHSQVVDMSIVAVQTRLDEARKQGQRLIDGTQDSALLVEDLRSAEIVIQMWGSYERRKLVKPDDGRKIDGAAALTYADQARREALSGGWEPRKEAPEPWVLFVQ